MEEARHESVQRFLLNALEEIRNARALLRNNHDDEKWELAAGSEWMELAVRIYQAQHMLNQANIELMRIDKEIPEPKSP